MQSKTVITQTHFIYQALTISALFVILWVFIPPVFAQEPTDILILNSDPSVKKYTMSQNVFQKHQNTRSHAVNLTDTSRDEVAKLIKNPTYKYIYTIGAKAYLLAHQYVKTEEKKKIIFSSLLNWRRFPMTKQSHGVAQELAAIMQLTMYRYLFPDIKKIGVLYSHQFNNEWMINAKQLANDVGITLVGQEVSSQKNLEQDLKQLLPEVDVLWLISDPLVLSSKSQVVDIFQLTKEHKKPIFTYNDIFVEMGALLVISADIPTIGRQLSAMVDGFRKNKMASEQVTPPVGSHIILNLKQLKTYSLKLNKEALSSVNQLIE